MSDGSKRFTFLPRPEAHPMNWDDLLPPLRCAARNLLLRIAGAADKAEHKPKDAENADVEWNIANCFLVYGDRGTGKTTILLSAKAAVSNPIQFFKKTHEEDARLANEAGVQLRDDAKACAEKLKDKSIVWLDVLDLEPLPPHANPLATMLTRVRNALCSPDGGSKPTETTSIFEEDADSARNKLNRLISEATLMWEGISESDTRGKANRQIVAADYYAQFRNRFVDAMATLSREIGRRSGSRDSDACHPIVLPVDNIDRSTDHLHNIVKLAQMVSCRYLWFVMAGDREDVETFLERAYWKELITLGESAAAIGKKGLGDEDETLVMARRQAAATAHKLFPPSHRIEIELVKPVETLRFCASSTNKSDRTNSTNCKSIYDLLEMIDIPNLGNGPKIRFIELFDARKRVEASEGLPDQDLVYFSELLEQADTPDEPKLRFLEILEVRKRGETISKTGEANNGLSRLAPEYLTQAARLGLQLPARSVLDLWQLVHWAVYDSTASPRKAVLQEEKKPDFRAEKIARTMLRNILAESKISNKAGRLLQEKIIRRDPSGATTLDFREPNPSLNVTHLRARDFESRGKLKNLPSDKGTEQSYAVRSTLFARGEEELILVSLKPNLSLKPNRVGKTHQTNHDNGEDDADMDWELPRLVSGWLTVLHDIVMWAEKSWVTSSPIHEIEICLLSVSHEVISSINGQRTRNKMKSLWWSAPSWNSFFAHTVFELRWGKIQSPIKEGCRRNQANPADYLPPDYLPRVLAVGWVVCVLDTFRALAPQGWDSSQDHTLDQQQREINPGEASKPELLSLIFKNCETEKWTDEGIKDVEKHVMGAAANLYSDILRNGSSSGHERVFFSDEGVTPMRDWLERKLPLLLSHLYVPMSEGANENRRDAIISHLRGRAETEALVKAWENNSDFILADMEKELAEIFMIDKKSAGSESGQQPKIPHYLEDLNFLGPFTDLHRLWLNSRY